MKSLTLVRENIAFYLVLIFSTCPTLTFQALSAGLLYPNTAEAKDNTLAQSGISTPYALRNSGVPAAVNITLENVGGSLARLEENLSGLIQSFTAVQRSVFNLEQLQELLVLLLEDILKQTGNIDRVSRKVPDPINRGSDSGGTSKFNDSSDDGSKDITSTENVDDANKDDEALVGKTNHVDERRTAGGDLAAGGGLPSGGGLAAGGDLATGIYGVSDQKVSHNIKDPNTASDKQIIDPNTGGGREESAGGSSEGGKSYSDEDSSYQKAANQRSAQTVDRIAPLRPQWSEPMTALPEKHTNSRFTDVVQRIASRLGQSAIRNSSPHRLGLMQMNLAVPVQHAESTLEHPPMYQPLEILAAHENLHTRENKLLPEILPIKVKLRQEPVVSHGGPQTGPEQRSSPYLEHSVGLLGIESTGERPSGMINNLMLFRQSAVSTKEGEHIQAVMPVLRKSRHVENILNDGKALKGTGSGSSKFSVAKHENKSLFSKNSSSAPNIRAFNKQDKYEKIAYKKEFTPISHTDLGLYPASLDVLSLNQHKTTNITSDSLTNQDFDFLIASLLTDLSSKLQEHQMKQIQSDVTTNSDINRAVSEINKLIWIPSDDASHFQPPSHVTQETPTEGTLETLENTSNTRVGTDKTRHKSLHAMSTEQFHDDSIKADSAIPMARHHASNKTNENSLSPKHSEFIKENDSNLETTTTPHTKEFSTVANMASQKNLVALNMSNANYTDWEWLLYLTDNTSFSEVDWVWLTDTLTQLSQNVQLTQDLRNLNERGRALLERRGNLEVNTETDIVINNKEDIHEDNTLNSVNDNSASSDNYDDTKSNENGDGSRDPTVYQDHFRTVPQDDDAVDRNYKSQRGGDSVSSDPASSKGKEEGKSSDEIIKDDENNINPQTIGDSITSVQHKEVQHRSQSRVPLITPFGLLPLQHNQLNQGSTDVHDGAGAIDYILHELRRSLRTSRVPTHKISSVRKKRHTGTSLKKFSHTSDKVRHFPLDLHTREQHKSDAYTKGKTHNQQNSQNSEANFLKSEPNSLIVGNKYSEMSSSRSDLDQRHNSANSHGNRQNSLNSRANSEGSHHPKMEYHGQRPPESQTFHIPLGGYANYFGYLGLNNPFFGFSGTNSLMPTERPSVEERSPMDLEDILTNLFMTYWQRFYSLYTKSTSSTTTLRDMDVEEEILTTVVTPPVVPSAPTTFIQNTDSTLENNTTTTVRTPARNETV